MEDETKHNRTEKLVVCCDANHEQSMFNEGDIDSSNIWIATFCCETADYYRVRELVKKIENHFHFQNLPRDLQQNKAQNLFSTTFKKTIQDMGNVELFELLETDLKTQCNERPSYWSAGIVYCTSGAFLER